MTQYTNTVCDVASNPTEAIAIDPPNDLYIDILT